MNSLSRSWRLQTFERRFPGQSAVATRSPGFRRWSNLCWTNTGYPGQNELLPNRRLNLTRSARRLRARCSAANKSHSVLLMTRDPNTSTLDNKPLFQQMPDKDAGVESWRDWALRLRKWAYSTSKGEKQRRNQLKKLRQELARKNSVFEHYKRRIADLEDQVASYEASIIVRMYRRFTSFFDKGSSNQ